MILFPAIDVLDNKAVRLLYGKRDDVTIYGTPVEMALKWQSLGAEYLHLVDLNGAFDNSFDNKKTLIEVVKNCKIPVQLGGGIKSLDKVKFYLEEVGVTRVIMGTACVINPDIADKACALFGNKIVAGIDSKDGFVAIKGWEEQSKLTPLKVAISMKERGVDTIVYTDISRDGALVGINIEETYELGKATGMNIIASGGAAAMQDVSKLIDLKIYGLILGKALYEGKINFDEAIEMVSSRRITN